MVNPHGCNARPLHNRITVHDPGLPSSRSIGRPARLGPRLIVLNLSLTHRFFLTATPLIGHFLLFALIHLIS